LSPLPPQMVNRWESRAEPSAGQGKLYWQILFRDDSEVQALASMAQERLASFAGLHFTPRQWLHMTTLVVGLTEDFTATETSWMVAFAREQLADISPTVISFGKVLYHSEAIALRVRPDGALDPVRNALWQATRKAIGEERITDDRRWVPHVTVAYSTSVQPRSSASFQNAKSLSVASILLYKKAQRAFRTGAALQKFLSKHRRIE
jgi:2'-5' RNA ligase